MAPTDCAASEPRRLRLGVSSCLLGNAVRYDGGHKRDRRLLALVEELVEFHAVCPEVEAGMSVPRESVRLVRRDGAVRVEGVTSGEDWTKRLETAAHRSALALAEADLDGFILKSRSPSCGLERVKVYDGNGVPAKTGEGVFARVLRDLHPHLPVEEEGRLADPRLGECFWERTFAYARVRDLFRSPWRPKELIEFHSREKLLLMAYDPALYGELGRLVAEVKSLSPKDVETRYLDGFLRALSKAPSRGRHLNALQHAMGFLKDVLPPADKGRLHDALSDYVCGLVPLVVPVSLIQHQLLAHGIVYLSRQSYFEPAPKRLKLRTALDV